MCDCAWKGSVNTPIMTRICDYHKWVMRKMVEQELKEERK